MPDNNTAERAIRPLVLGRRNYLFAGSDAGGEHAAALYSLIGTAKLNGLDPEAYLRQILGCIADHPINRVGELLPWTIIKQVHDDDRLAAGSTSARQCGVQLTLTQKKGWP